jgi:hypothetical protein
MVADINRNARPTSSESADNGEEGLSFNSNSLLVSNNAFINAASHSTAIYDPNCVTVELSNNTFQGVANLVDPPSCAAYQDTQPSQAASPPSSGVSTPSSPNLGGTAFGNFPVSSVPVPRSNTNFGQFPIGNGNVTNPFVAAPVDR